MAPSPYIRGIRERLGQQLLLLPSVTVLCQDDAGRVLLVRQVDSGQWATIGGAVEPDEDPRVAAIREAKEEAGIDVQLGQVLDVLGGPAFRIRYSNGDEVAYVTSVFDARVVGGELAGDGEETNEVAWFERGGLAEADLGSFARASLAALGWLS
ncbi:MAG: NUDIX domain-containing protein [Actinomycetota bacterium]|nr:NUDIX domain-containing protein [Actinomycetota bacterium]